MLVGTRLIGSKSILNTNQYLPHDLQFCIRVGPHRRDLTCRLVQERSAADYNTWQMGKIRKMSSTDHKSTFLLQIFTGFHPCKGTMRPVWTSLAMQGLVFMKETRFLHLAPKFGLVAVTHWHSGSRAFYNRNRSSDINIQFPCLIFVFLLPYDLPETAFFLVTRCTEIDQS